MGDIDPAAIFALSVEDRLRLVELIWARIAAEPSAAPLSEADRHHRRVPSGTRRDSDDVVTREQVLAEVYRDRRQATRDA